MNKTNLKKIFRKEKNILIGMIHLPPLLSIDGFSGMDKLIKKALADLENLEKAGFDAVLVENDDDKPHTEFANEAQIASLTVVAQEVCKNAKIPVGVQMMLNDWKSSFSIAKAVGAQFTRLDVFVDHVTCEWCEINPSPKEIIKFKNKIYPELFLLTDIQVKYKKMVKERPLGRSAQLAVDNHSDGLVITGEATGVETPLARIKEVRKTLPKFPIFVGAGINENNIIEQLSVANGAIVGSSIKKGDKIDLVKAKRLVSRVKS
jgi:membrane complex biogenesis BtpA family protein